MNKNYMFIGFIAVGALGIVGAGFLIFVKSEGADKFIQYVFSILSVLGAMGVTLWGLNKTHDQQSNLEGEVKTVKEQTNGSLHRRDEQIEELKAINAELMVELAVVRKENEMIKETNNV